jgi:hypothetical protein
MVFIVLVGDASAVASYFCSGGMEGNMSLGGKQRRETATSAAGTRSNARRKRGGQIKN